MRDVTDRKREELRAQALLDRRARSRDVRRALAEDGLVLHAQPIVDLRDGRVVSEELLVRMRNREGQVLLPGEFLPAAEEFGLMANLDRWVLRRAAAMAAAGRHLHVNVSAQSLGDPSLATMVAELLAECGASPAMLVFEVTETALMQNVETAERFARRLDDLGATLALDDFGTGYSTLTHLKRLSAKVLKIDREFIADITTNPASRNVVEAVVGLAQRFGQRTVAEGVEDADTAKLLRELGVDRAQGFFFGRPAPLAS
jgi:EAL domain-containing protein (putative c-di-GMP-specific phosphodiesterase class I)